MKRTRRAPRAKRRRPPPRDRGAGGETGGEVTALAGEVLIHTETSPRLTGGDLDADWASAYATGEEAVGGSVATPDQDVVDEIGDALGVGQAPDAEVRTSSEILGERDRHRWRGERAAEDDNNGPPRPPRRQP